MSKKYWKNTYEYKRILEILDDYWLTEKDELAVEVRMYFRKSDGQFQSKRIRWMNPDRLEKLQRLRFENIYTQQNDFPDWMVGELWKKQSQY